MKEWWGLSAYIGANIVVLAPNDLGGDCGRGLPWRQWHGLFLDLIELFGCLFSRQNI
jgi:hypothetical protein